MKAIRREGDRNQYRNRIPPISQDGRLTSAVANPYTFPMSTDPHQPKKIVLAYSGGLDTSVILPWLKDRYPGVKLVAFAAELGQGDELKGIEDKARKSGADEVIIRDLRKEFIENFCFPMLRAHAIYENDYLL